MLVTGNGEPCLRKEFHNSKYTVRWMTSYRERVTTSLEIPIGIVNDYLLGLS